MIYPTLLTFLTCTSASILTNPKKQTVTKKIADPEKYTVTLSDCAEWDVDEYYEDELSDCIEILQTHATTKKMGKPGGARDKILNRVTLLADRLLDLQGSPPTPKKPSKAAAKVDKSDRCFDAAIDALNNEELDVCISQLQSAALSLPKTSGQPDGLYERITSRIQLMLQRKVSKSKPNPTITTSPLRKNSPLLTTYQTLLKTNAKAAEMVVMIDKAIGQVEACKWDSVAEWRDATVFKCSDAIGELVSSDKVQAKISAAVAAREISGAEHKSLLLILDDFINKYADLIEVMISRFRDLQLQAVREPDCFTFKQPEIVNWAQSKFQACQKVNFNVEKMLTDIWGIAQRKTCTDESIDCSSAVRLKILEDASVPNVANVLPEPSLSFEQCMEGGAGKRRQCMVTFESMACDDKYAGSVIYPNLAECTLMALAMVRMTPQSDPDYKRVLQLWQKYRVELGDCWFTVIAILLTVALMISTLYYGRAESPDGAGRYVFTGLSIGLIAMIIVWQGFRYHAKNDDGASK